MVTMRTNRRTLIVARMERDELHGISSAKRASVSLTRYSGTRGGGLIELALGSFALHVNYLPA